MSLFRKIENIKAQIVDTERLLEMVIDHPLMTEALEERLSGLKNELESYPKLTSEPRIQLLFSGNAVKGSQGIKSTFLTKTIKPFQEIVKTQAALIRFGRVGKRGQVKTGPNTDLFLTALPTGSFGVELTQLDSNDLFDSEEVSNAMKQAAQLVNSAALDDETFESAIENTPKRNLTNLKRFLKEAHKQKSMIKMETNEIGIQISEEKVDQAYLRVAFTKDTKNEIFISGIFRGLLLDSGKFEIQDDEGKTITGFINQDLEENELIIYDRKFLNEQCKIHLQVHTTEFKTGREKISYELLGISEE